MGRGVFLLVVAALLVYLVTPDPSPRSWTTQAAEIHQTEAALTSDGVTLPHRECATPQPVAAHPAPVAAPRPAERSRPAAHRCPLSLLQVLRR
ncbi:hypothetical protein ACFWN2_33305 [Lentzea sp. NPDC058436]|uniref:hypothetical protein n=1 Tax=Lentzea sp. NPDC058436 TaxID=3346499 RepID=UPI00366019CB